VHYGLGSVWHSRVHYGLGSRVHYGLVAITLLTKID
jgi:hypothetical protein